MRTLTLAMAVVISTVYSCMAQSAVSFKSGLYLSAADFTNSTLSYAIDCGGSDKIATHALFGSSSV
ncbi:MAG: hypothetical protein JST39_24560, partial [Bacteroidetes bacterium]|nr:hypothetical protein [Bacteroidota bacterium]